MFCHNLFIIIKFHISLVISQFLTYFYFLLLFILPSYYKIQYIRINLHFHASTFSISMMVKLQYTLYLNNMLKFKAALTLKNYYCYCF